MRDFAYPVFLDLKNKPCLVVGGGQVALRKVERLINAEAEVTVVSPQTVSKLQELAEAKKIKLCQRPFQFSDLNNVFLCIVATTDTNLNKRIANTAKEKKVLVNVVDNPAESSFIVPAVVQRQPLTIAVSTNGRFPGLAKKLRQELEKQFSAKYQEYVQILAEARKHILRRPVEHEEKARQIKKLLALPLLEELHAGKKVTVAELVKRVTRD